MKIALLNLQYDNNYGGNLQRYALMTVLQRMGHDVTHLNLRFKFYPDSKLKFLKILFWRTYDKFIKRKSISVFQEKRQKRDYIQRCETTDTFYNKYIQHTPIIETKKDLVKYTDFNMFIVGSDQVWRKDYAQMHDIGTYFFDYLKDSPSPKVAYGVSIGKNSMELSQAETSKLTELYQLFKAVSVREQNALKLLRNLHWNKPQARLVLDPTLLLTINDYKKIIQEENTTNPSGNLFCYILDLNTTKEKIIKSIAQSKLLTPFYVDLDKRRCSIPQWLRSFDEASFVITDSYHGVIFSIIFKKPFFLLENKSRGQSRFQNLSESLGIEFDSSKMNWDSVEKKISLGQQESINFLIENLK